MSITTKQKVYGCVLVVGLSAFAADKALFAPSDAAAQDSSVSEYAVTSSTSALDAARSDLTAMANVPAEGSDIADRLSAVARSLDLTDVRDAFKPSPGWIGDEGTVQQQDQLRSGPAAATFVQSHRLMAVMAGGPNGSAIVNDTCLFIGQQIDGFRLISVGARSAVLESNGVQVELELSQEERKSSTD
ncbi:MAG: hypothetical protein V3T53_05880 [Phycisphaerales bacterium]